MFRSGKIFGTPASLALLISLFPSLARAGTWAAFGPKTYTRGSGAPVTSTDTITLPHPGTQYTLRIFNGGLEHNHALFVSNCEVSLNGVRIAGPKKCNDKTSEVSIPVTPLGSNILSVTVRGRKGSALAIEIIGVDNDPPTISAAIDPLPDAAGWNSSAVRVTFACADALSGVASCSPPVTLSSEVVGKVVTGTATDVAGNTATVSATVNISFTFFKVRSWQTNLPGDPLQTGKCLDYGASSSGTSVFLNDCVNAHSVRVVEISPRDQTDAQGNLIALCQQDNPPNPPIPHTFCHEVMLFAGNQVIGIDAPQTTNGGFGGPPTTEYTLTLQTPWTSFHGVIPPNISPAHQIFAYDGDSIILESSRPCVNTGATTAANICPPPPSQMVIQIQNARGANGSALVAGLRNLADNEFWDFVPLPGSSPYPTTGFVPVATSYDLWNAICMTPTVNRALGVPSIGSSTNPMLAFTGQFGPGAFAGCVAPNAGWGSVIVVTDSDPNECVDPETNAGSPPNIGPCIDLSYYPPLVLPAGVTVRGNRRDTSFGPQLYLNDFAPGTRPSPPGACDCIASIQGDYARVTGLRLRGQSRSTTFDEPGTEGVDVAFPLQPPGSVSLTEFIATVDHNDMSDWGSAAVKVLNPYPDNSFGDVKNEAATLANVTIARNFLHHNERDRDGYGVLVGRALIQGNTSLMNRHTIAAGGEPHNEYRASYNLMLHSPQYCLTIAGITGCYHNQDFDIHGTGDGGYGGTAGYHIDILGNTFLEPDGHDYWLRGRPLRHSDYFGNVSLRKENDAVQDVLCSPDLFHRTCIGNDTDPFFPVNIYSNNQFADSTPPIPIPQGNSASAISTVPAPTTCFWRLARLGTTRQAAKLSGASLAQRWIGLTACYWVTLTATAAPMSSE